MHWKPLSLVLCLAAFLSACGDASTPRTYTVPKEDGTLGTAAPAPRVAPTAGGTSMAGQTLPPEMLNQNAILPAWKIPSTWQEQAPAPMRMATFAAPGPGGAADIAITSFPGDVGGMLANVNRWRGQLNLPPTTQRELDGSIATLDTRSGDAVLLEFSNGTTSTLVATLRHDGASWFMKMTGPAATVTAEAANFRSFVRSTDFAATHQH